MAPTRKPPVRRAAAAPQNQSRGAGQAAPASAAARAPMEGAHGSFYDPADDAGVGRANSSGLASFTETVRERSIPIERGGSVDMEVLEHMAADAEQDPNVLAADIARIRAFRKPIGAMSQKLALPERRGYHRHWFNDVAGRIGEAEANGWAHIKGTDGKPLSRVVGSGRDRGSLYGFAMELPLVFWQEDQDAKNKAATDRIEGLKAAPFRAATGQSKAADKGKFYDPNEESGAGPLQVVKG